METDMAQKKTKIYLCDDDGQFVGDIREMIDNELSGRREYEIMTFTGGHDLIGQWNKEFADVVFLDIDMPEADGLEIASMLQKSKEDVFILFVTNQEDKVQQTFEYHPFWFVRKSHLSELRDILQKLMKKIDAENERKRLVFNLKADNSVIELDINTLIYIESLRNDIIIRDRVKNTIQVRCKISEAEKQLYPLRIIRIQNGILVNCRFISKITSREVLLTNGTRFNVSRSRAEYIKGEYQRFVRDIMI